MTDADQEQVFTFGPYTWDITCAEEYVEEHEPREVPLPTQLMGMIRIDKEYASDHPYPDKPIIIAPIADEEGWFGIPIDGWHRIRHWHDKGAETIMAVFLEPQEAYQCLLYGGDVFRRLAKKAEPGLRLRKKKKAKRR